MPYPENNIYNIIHTSLVDMVIDDDTKIFTGLFRLDEKDILTLQLSKIIYIDGVYYIINKVENVEINDRRLTKVELVKFNEATTAVEGRIPILSIVLTTDEDEVLLTDDNLELII